MERNDNQLKSCRVMFITRLVTFAAKATKSVVIVIRAVTYAAVQSGTIICLV